MGFVLYVFAVCLCYGFCGLEWLSDGTRIGCGFYDGFPPSPRTSEGRLLRGSTNRGAQPAPLPIQNPPVRVDLKGRHVI